MGVYMCTKRCRNCEKYKGPSTYYCETEECFVEESTEKSEEQLILEEYMEQGFRWIYKYEDKDKWKNSGKYGTRIFYSQPWFSLEGGMTWVDVDSCEPFVSRDESRQAIFIDLDIVDLDEPIKIEEYIENYC